MRNQIIVRFVLIIVFALCLTVPGYAQSNSGSVCISPTGSPDDLDRNVGNPSFNERASVYEIQIGNKPKVTTSFDDSVKIGGLATNKKLLVKILVKGKVIESFKFNFSEYSSQKLCLWLNSFYGTWSLSTAKDAGKKCRCK